MMQSFEVIVVGGGVTGASILYHLASQLRGRVALLERDYFASGPTAYSTAVIRQHYTHPLTARMARDSLRFLRNFRDFTGTDCRFQEVGLLVGAGPDRRAELESAVAVQRLVRIRVELLSPEDARGIDPLLLTQDFELLAWEPEAGYADPHATTMGFIQAARELGAEARPYAEVHAVVAQDGQISGVRLKEDRIRAPKVVLAAGPWTPRLARTALPELELPIVPSRHPVLKMHPPAGTRPPRTVLFDLGQQVYSRPDGPNRLLVGSLDPARAGDEADPDHYARLPTSREQLELAQAIGHRYPYLAEAGLEGGWAGIYDVTPDWHPILDELEELPGLYVAAGMSGHGYKLAPSHGEMMARLILEGRSAEDPIWHFRRERLAAARLLQGAYGPSLIG